MLTAFAPPKPKLFTDARRVPGPSHGTYLSATCTDSQCTLPIIHEGDKRNTLRSPSSMIRVFRKLSYLHIAFPERYLVVLGLEIAIG